MAYQFYGYQQYPQTFQQPQYQQSVPDQLQQYRNMQQQTYQQPTDDRIWVQNRTAAESYLVAPNNFVRLWDSNSQCFYEKRADQAGRLYMETYEYHKASEEPKKAAPVDYEAKIKALEERIAVLERRGANVPESDSNDTAV